MPGGAYAQSITAKSRFRERDLRANLPSGKAISVPALKRVVPDLAEIGAGAPLDRRTTCRKLSSRLASWPSSQPARPSPSRCRWPSPPSRLTPASTNNLRAGRGGRRRLAPAIPAGAVAFCDTPQVYLAEISFLEYAPNHSNNEWGRVKWSEFLWARLPARLCLWAVRPSRSLHLSPSSRSIPANMAALSPVAARADRLDGSSTCNTRPLCPIVRSSAGRSRPRLPQQRSDRPNACPSRVADLRVSRRERLARQLRTTRRAGNSVALLTLSTRRPNIFKGEGASC